MKFTFTAAPGGANASVAGAALVLRQDAPPGPLPPNVFRTWAALYAVYVLTDGPAIIEFDNTYATCVIGPAAEYTFRADTWLSGALRLFPSGPDFLTRVNIEDGVTFGGTNLSVEEMLSLVSLSSAPVIDVGPGDGLFRIALFTGARLRAEGTAPFCRTSAPSMPTLNGFFFLLVLGGTFESGISAVLDMPDISPDVTFATFVLSDSAEINSNTITGSGIAFVQLLLDEASAVVSFSQPGFSSTLGPLNQIAASQTMPNQTSDDVPQAVQRFAGASSTGGRSAGRRASDGGR